ncbi:hypothetical protein BGZ54_003106 [Gamsiella multidivaricata]|nr:hypothetical protein BGZ54_003106 [Gamsiella multidivaricata]
MLSEIGMKAVEISRMIHEDAQDHVDSTAGSKEIRRLLTSLFEDDFLWDKADFNELELMQHLFNPFLKTFFGGMPGWTKSSNRPGIAARWTTPMPKVGGQTTSWS